MSCWSANPISAPTGCGGWSSASPPANAALGDRIAALLAPLGIVRGPDAADAGTDLGPYRRAGAAAIDLNQDGTRYFDYHHTPDDTLDKVDPAQLRQNVAAWTAMLAAAADAPERIEPQARRLRADRLTFTVAQSTSLPTPGASRGSLLVRTDHVELFVAGNNLLHRTHAESNDANRGQLAERSVYVGTSPL